MSGDKQYRRSIFEDEYLYILDHLNDGKMQPTASELLSLLEKEGQFRLNWMPREDFWAVVDRLRNTTSLQSYLRRYINDFLNDDEIAIALFGDPQKLGRERSSLDELFHRSQALRTSESFKELIRFTAKFKEYKPFNNMLVRLQRPGATYFATERDWRNNFRRWIKEDANPILILAPMTPLICVYDIDDTDGAPLPALMDDFAKVDGRIDPKMLENTIKNCQRKGIEVALKPMEILYGGYATTRVSGKKSKMRIVVNQNYSNEQQFSVLCHEIAHILLGHLGGDDDGWWPTRINLSHRSVEIEAESVAYMVCARVGLNSSAEAYLARHNPEPSELAKISVDLIVRVAGLIESMGEGLLPLGKIRKPSGVKKHDEVGSSPPQQLLFFTEGDIPISDDFEESVYEQAWPHFEAMWKGQFAEKQDMRGLFQNLLKNLGIRAKPYVVRFAREKSINSTLCSMGLIELKTSRSLPRNFA